MDVTKLVVQMQETLSTIHTTIAALDTSEHDAKLDELEAKRDATIKQLLSAFAAESEALSRKREAKRVEIADRRRREDEERERIRRQEDEELAARDHQEDEARDGALLAQTNVVEEETDTMMDQIEEEAQRAIEDGHQKLMALEKKRQELNRLIDEQLRAPLPQMTRRRSRRGSSMPPVVATESKPPELMSPPESINNSESKALELQETQRGEQGPRDVAVAVLRGESPVEKRMDQVKPIPQAGMEEQVLDKALERQDIIANARQLEPHLRPLSVEPVISRNGEFIHAENQREKKSSVEPVGTPTHDLASSETSGSPNRDMTWWEEKREAEALALQAKEDVHDHGETSPLGVGETGSFDNDKHQDGTVECMATLPQHPAAPEPETLLPAVFGGTLGQMDRIHSEGEDVEKGNPHRRENGSTEDPFAQDPKPAEPRVKNDLALDKALRESPQADNVTAESRSTDGQDLRDDGPVPTDVPLAAPTSRGSLSPNDGHTPFETACEQFDVEQHPRSAINYQTRSHENGHVLVADDAHDDCHGSYFGYHSRDPSAPRTELSATPEHEFSAEGEEHESYSVWSQGNLERDEYPEILVRDAASVALPQELHDSYSKSNASGHTSPSDVETELDDRVTDHHPGIVAVGHLEEEEVGTPLERLPSRRPEPDLHQNTQDVRTEVTLPAPTNEGIELRSPLLKPIPEHQEVHHRMEDSVGLLQEDFGLGIRDSYAEVQHLGHDYEDGENSDYDNISHNDFEEDDYMHQNSAMAMQPSRTDTSARGSLAGDGDLQDLQGYASRPGQRDASSDYGDPGSVRDHPDNGVIPGSAVLGLEDRAAGVEQSVQAANGAAPVPDMTEEKPGMEMRDGIAEDKNLGDGRRAAAEPASGPPSPTSTAESEDVRDEENATHTPTNPFKDPRSQIIDEETEINSTVAGQLGGVAAAEVQNPEAQEEALEDVIRIETSALSGPMSLDDHEQESSSGAIKNDHADIEVNGQIAEGTLASPALRSPGPIYGVQESLADQLRRARWEEANQSYHDDEPSQLEWQHEYTTTVHGEAGLFDDESSDGDSAYGKELHDVETTQEDSHARTPAEDRSFDAPESRNVADQHEGQPKTPVALITEKTQAAQQMAEENVEEPQPASTSEQLAVGPEASAKPIQEEPNESREITHGPQEPHSPVQSEVSHEHKDKQLQSLPMNQQLDDAEVSAQAALQTDDFHRELESPNPAMPIETPVLVRPEERLDSHDTQQQAGFSSVAVPLERKLKSPEHEMPRIDMLEQQTSHGSFSHEAAGLEEPELSELQQSTTPVRALVIHESQHESLRQRSWMEKVDNYTDDDEEEQQTNAETPLMQSTDSSLEAYQQTPPSAEKDLATSEHETERPKTPEDNEETIDGDSRTWHARQASSPQSMRTGSTVSSAPSSPVQTRDSHEPVIRGLVNTSSPSYAGRPRNDSYLTEYTGRPRNDSSLTEYNPHEPSEPPKTQFSSGPLVPRWEPSDQPLDADGNSHRKSDIGSGGGSLFQRMRSVFEQSQPDNSNSSRASWTGGYPSRNSFSKYYADEHGDSEQSGLLDDRYNGHGH